MNQLRSLTFKRIQSFTQPNPPAEPSKSIYDLQNANKYINENIRKFDWSSYVVKNYYPIQVREAFLAINQFNLELQRITEASKEVNLAQGKLDFWQNSIDTIFEDKLIKEPVAIALHNACKKNPISKLNFNRLINIRRAEVSSKELSDINQLVLLSEGIRTTMIYMNLDLLRIDYKNNIDLQACAISVGRGLGIVDYIKRIPYSLKKYKLFMPEDVLRKHGVSVRTLWDRVEGRPKDELADVVLEVAALAKKYLDESQKYKDLIPKNAHRAFLHVVEAQQFLETLEQVNFDIFHRGIHSNSYILLPYRTWKASRQSKFFK